MNAIPIVVAGLALYLLEGVLKVDRHQMVFDAFAGLAYRMAGTLGNLNVWQFGPLGDR